MSDNCLLLGENVSLAMGNAGQQFFLEETPVQIGENEQIVTQGALCGNLQLIVQTQSGEDQRLKNLLKEMNVEAAYDKFYAYGITYDRLKYINCDDLALAFPCNENIGYRAELREKIKLWKHKNFPEESLSTLSMNSNVQNWLENQPLHSPASSSNSAKVTLKVYYAVIEDVIANVRDAFLDEGVDEQVLQEMKQNWRAKLMASKAVEINPEPPEPQPPPIVANNPKPSKAAAAKAKKAAAAAAAAAAQQNSNNASSSGSTGPTTNTSADIKPNIAQLQSNISNGGGGGGISTTIGAGGPTTSAAASSAIAMNGGGSAKHELGKPTLSQINSTATNLQQKLNVIGGGSTQGGTGLAASSSGIGGGGGAAASNSQHPTNPTIPIVATLDPNRIMPVNITLPAQTGSMNTESRVLTIHVPASALQDNQLTQILTAHLISSIMSLPTTLASSVLQQHVNAALISSNMQKNFNASKQLDGAIDTSDEDESEESDDNMDNDDDDDLDKDDDEDVENDGGAEEEPLNSDDDVTDEDASDVFETDNVIVCQYDKITRSRNKWKFYLKDGIMNIGGKDYVFQKSNGDAEW